MSYTDIFEEKPYEQIFTKDILKFAKLLKYKSVKLESKGSSSLKSIKYPADYDFYCYLNPESGDDMYKYFSDIVDKINRSKNIYLINISAGSHTTGDRHLIEFDKEKTSLDKDEFKRALAGANYIQIECVIKIKNKLKSMTADYYLYKKKTQEDVLRDLKKGIIDNKEKKKYMKVLKRIFNEVGILDPESEKSIKLLTFFNSKYGKMYMDDMNLRAIKTALDKYSNKELMADAIKNIKSLKIDTSIKKLDDVSKDYDEKVNKAAKKIMDSL